MSHHDDTHMHEACRHIREEAMTTHPTPAPTTPEEARKLAEGIEPGDSQTWLTIRYAIRCLRSLAAQVEALGKERDEKQKWITDVGRLSCGGQCPSCGYHAIRTHYEQELRVKEAEAERDALRARVEEVITQRGALLTRLEKLEPMISDVVNRGADDYIELRKENAALRADLERARGENAELRYAYATVYAGARLYMDDGELQDSSAHPFIDFKRDPWEVVRAKLAQRAKDLAAQPPAPGRGDRP